MSYVLNYGGVQILGDSLAQPLGGPQTVRVDFVPAFDAPPTVVITPFNGAAVVPSSDTIVSIATDHCMVHTRNGDARYKINWMAMGTRKG